MACVARSYIDVVEKEVIQVIHLEMCSPFLVSESHGVRDQPHRPKTNQNILKAMKIFVETHLQAFQSQSSRSDPRTTMCWRRKTIYTHIYIYTYIYSLLFPVPFSDDGCYYNHAQMQVGARLLKTSLPILEFRGCSIRTKNVRSCPTILRISVKFLTMRFESLTPKTVVSPYGPNLFFLLCLILPEHE